MSIKFKDHVAPHNPRRRISLTITIRPDARQALEALADVHGISISRAVEGLVLAYAPALAKDAK
jgi:hypothetical protein